MRPLDDITVVEIDSWMAAPSACAILADLGATVIKVEPLSGDPMRGNSRTPKIDDELAKSFDYQFDVANRGKHSIALNLASEVGQDVVHRLVAGANVLVCNLLASRQKRFRVDPETLFELNPTLVHATLTGYGTVGPEAERPGYDSTAFFARSGLHYMMREGESGVPPMTRTAQGDYTTGLALVSAILSGLRMAERTGLPQSVEASLLETAVWTQATDFSVTLQDRAPLRPRDRHNQIIATSNRFPCKDGNWIVITEPRTDAWEDFCRAIDREVWIDDERFKDMRSRFRNMPDLVAQIDEALSTKTRDEWGVVFDKAGIVWAPVLGLDEVIEDEQCTALNLFPTIESADIGLYQTVSNPVVFKTCDVDPSIGSPKVGEHTRLVLETADFAAEEIEEIMASGQVKQA